MNLSESLANAYDEFNDQSAHLLLAKDKKGNYQLVADTSSAKKMHLKITSAAKTLKLLANDLTSLQMLSPKQKENLKKAAEHLALRAKKETTLEGFKNKILLFFRKTQSKARDTDYQKVMKALESVQQPTVKIKSTVANNQNQLFPRIEEHFEKLKMSNLPFPNATDTYWVPFSSLMEQEKPLPSNELYVFSNQTTDKPLPESTFASSSAKSFEDSKVPVPPEDSFDDLFISFKPLEKVADFKADFDEMFSASKNPPFTFDEGKLQKFGITLEDLQLIHYFQKSAGVPDSAILKYQKGYGVTTSSQVAGILKVTTSTSTVLEGSLSALQQELAEEGKDSFSVMQLTDSVVDTTFVDPSGKSISLDEYKDNPQKAVYINYNHGHFTLIKLDPDKKQVQFYDSMGRPGVAPDSSNMECLRALAKKLQWTVVVEAGPRQYNGTDCGLFCYEKARRFCKGIPEDDFKAEDIPYVRLEAVATYLKSSRFLPKEQADWFEARLKVPTSVYYFNRKILPFKVEQLKKCLDGEEEPQGLTRDELETLIDKKQIPRSCILKILDHIDELKSEIGGPSLGKVPSRKEVEAIDDPNEKEKVILESLQKLYNTFYRSRYTSKDGKSLKDDFCVMITLLLLKNG